MTKLRGRALLAELRHRKVIRVAAVYAATGFAVMQAAAILVPALHLPAWAVTLVVVLLALGFPVALALSWAFELTPEGLRATPPGGPDSAAATPALLGRRTLLVSGALVLAGLAFGAGWVLGPDAHTGGVRPAAAASVVSVGVLPFVDLSGDRSQEYFGDGIAEELLNVLARADDVSVASRTSSFAFKGRGMSVRQIAEELGVDHIVDGSVRKSGERLRIAAQVIDVRSDRQLWSETFDRQMDDIFRIQDEIATAVASALRVRLTGSEPVAAGTRDAEAYDLYLLGLYHWNKRTPEGLFRALEVFAAATERDPGFARAWAGLGFTYYVLPEYADYDPALARDQAREAAARAVRLDPESSEARTALGAALHMAGGFATALAEYDRAIALDPAFPTAHHWRGILLTAMGQLGAGEVALRHALRLDPASLPMQHFLALNLDMQRRTAEALAELDALLARAPEFRSALISAFVFSAQLGRARESEPRLARYLRGIGEDPAQATAIVDGILDPRLRERAIATVDGIVGRRTATTRAGAGDLFYLVDLFALLHAREQTLRMLEADAEWYLHVHRTVHDFLRDEPRFQALAAREVGL